MAIWETSGNPYIRKIEANVIPRRHTHQSINYYQFNMTRVQCPNCPKNYAGTGGLKQHMDKHHPEPGSQPRYQCGFCWRSHANSSNLERHLMSCKKNSDRVVPLDGKFTCEECASVGIHKGFKAKGGLFTHCNKNHGTTKDVWDCLWRSCHAEKPPPAIALPKPPAHWICVRAI